MKVKVTFTPTELDFLSYVWDLGGIDGLTIDATVLSGYEKFNKVVDLAEIISAGVVQPYLCRDFDSYLSFVRSEVASMVEPE